MPSRSLAKGKKLLLGGEEKKEVPSGGENWWGQYTKTEEECSRHPHPPAPELSAEEDHCCSFSTGWASRLCPDLAGHPATGSGISPTPSPSPFPLSGSCASTSCSPLGFLQQGTAQPQHADSTDSKPSETEGICSSLHSPHLSRTLVTHQ